MSMTIRQFTILDDVSFDAQAEARTELGHHLFDLRVHTLFMLFNATLATYIGVRVSGLDSAVLSQDSAIFSMPADFMSGCALTVFLVIAALCLLEAYRSW
jgi:hypothetical protein